MSGRVVLRYSKRLINRLYAPISSKALPLSACNFTDGSVGVGAGLDQSIPDSCKRSRQYFLCDSEIPACE